MVSSSRKFAKLEFSEKKNLRSSRFAAASYDYQVMMYPLIGVLERALDPSSSVRFVSIVWNGVEWYRTV